MEEKNLLPFVDMLKITSDVYYEEVTDKKLDINDFDFLVGKILHKSRGQISHRIACKLVVCMFDANRLENDK